MPLIKTDHEPKDAGTPLAIIILSLTSVLAIYAGYWLWEVIKAMWPIVE